MGEWVSLLKKELKVTGSSVLWGLVIVIAAGLLEIYLAYRYRSGAAIVLAIIVVAFHAFYLAIYMLKSLSNEWKNAHLWLHLPRSGWSLISAKLASGLMAMLVSLGISCIFALWVLAVELNNYPQTAEIVRSVILNYGWFMALLFLAGAIYNGFWAMMISIAMASTKNFIKRGRFFIGVGVFLIPTWGMGALQDTAAYDLLTKWGAVNLPLTTLNGLEHFHVQQMFHVGEFLFFTLVMGAVFYLCGWLLDNKVEV